MKGLRFSEEQWREHQAKNTRFQRVADAIRDGNYETITVKPVNESSAGAGAHRNAAPPSASSSPVAGSPINETEAGSPAHAARPESQRRDCDAPTTRATTVGATSGAGVAPGPSHLMTPFELACHAADIPAVAEYRFHPIRKWRFDYAWPEAKLALEVEGGLWTGGRHSRGSGAIADLEKYSEAAVWGWRLLYATPQEVKQGIALDRALRALGKDSPSS